MTIVHRIFTPAFLQRPNVHRSRTTSRAKNVEAPAEGASCGITSAPWAGLYLEINENTDANVDNAAASGLLPNSDLERFLASLMYGE